MSTANTLAPGTLVGSYQIIDIIAQGGMGIVYRAQHRVLKREAALKILFPHLAADTEFTQRFLREGMAMGQLKHPNIVEVYDANVADGLYYLAIEYLPGGTLHKQLDHMHELKQFMPVDIALSAIRQVALALDYAHSKGFVHRDIKPSNILIAADGRYVLTDFGIVHTEGAAKLTRNVEAMGTPEYMSPEQAQGLKVDGRSDIYSLGIVLYEMLTGKPPFVADTPWGTVYKHIKEPPTPITRVRTDLPSAVVEIANKAIAKRPEDRFQKAGDMAAAIDAILRVKASNKATAAAGSSNRPLIIGGIAIAALVIVAAVAVVGSTLFAAGNPSANATAPAATLVAAATRRTGATSATDNASTSATVEPTKANSNATATGPAAKATSTATVEATPLPLKTAVPINTAVSGKAPKADQLFDFEQALKWRIGDQPYGSLEQSNAQAHDGTFSAKLSYDIPEVSSAFVVFNNDAPLAGQPTGLVAWVYGDASGNYLNTWIGDSQGQVREYSFGRIVHTGWLQMFAWFDDSRPWPNTYISGPDNGKLTAPLTFKAFVLDAVPHGVATKGAIYIDEVQLTTKAAPKADVTPIPTAPAALTLITGTTPSALDFIFRNYTVGRSLSGRPTSTDGCSSFSTDGTDQWLKYEVSFDIVNSGQTDITNWSPLFISNSRNVLPTCVNKAGSTTIAIGASTHLAYTLYMTDQYLESIEVKAPNITRKLCVDAFGKSITPC